MLNQASGDTNDSAPLGNRARTEVDLPFPIVLRGKSPRGEHFELSTVVNRLSGHHVTLQLAESLPMGVRLFGYVRLLPVYTPDRPTPGVAFHGVVQSNKRQHDNRWRVTLTFERHRFLYAAASAEG